jgi:hypothetical protein
MNPDFEKWLKEQTYTLTSIRVPYTWDELIFHSKRTDYTPESKFTWGLWRKIRA